MIPRCRFDRPDSNIDEEEHTMYNYAMIVWMLQEKMGLSFEMACMYLHPFRKDPVKRLLEFRPGYDVGDHGQMQDMEAKLLKEIESREPEIRDWMSKNCRRFALQLDYTNVDYDEGTDEPEFSRFA